MVTGAARLAFKGVIHAVGPRYERGWQSVSFPAVSAGIFAVPLEICARAYLKTARAAGLRNVRLCLRDQPVIDTVLKELKR